MKNIGLYIHIPFCVSKCKYCNFNSYANKSDLQFDYLLAIKKELSSYKSKLKNYEIDTIFIGGGTPSSFFAGAISKIIEEINKNFKVKKNAEISIESNPNTITIEKALEWKNCGINRVSVGLQTSNNYILKLIGRTHTKKDYVNAMKILKSAGFDNINTDLMIGLPYQKQLDIKNSINLAVKLGSTHISAYSLILEENTPLYFEVNKNQIKLPKEEKNVNMYNFSNKYLKKFGFNRYEVSNFSLNKKECLHNLNCWNMIEYVGIGAGAHSFFNNNRYSNYNSIEEYILNINKLNSAIELSENLTKDDFAEEFIMLGLRTVKGINLLTYTKNFGVDLLKIKNDQIKNLLKYNLINIDNNYLFATDLGFLVLNKIILDLVY